MFIFEYVSEIIHLKKNTLNRVIIKYIQSHYKDILMLK